MRLFVSALASVILQSQLTSSYFKICWIRQQDLNRPMDSHCLCNLFPVRWPQNGIMIFPIGLGLFHVFSSVVTICHDNKPLPLDPFGPNQNCFTCVEDACAPEIIRKRWFGWQLCLSVACWVVSWLRVLGLVSYTNFSIIQSWWNILKCSYLFHINGIVITNLFKSIILKCSQ